MADCVDIAREFADRLSMELNVPVYLYGEAQEREYRRDLSQIREGEYEALYSKVKTRMKILYGNSNEVIF
jgi:glutamate formiminotransferase/formiminotetrahydrofolate cyclodeaminase